MAIESIKNHQIVSQTQNRTHKKAEVPEFHYEEKNTKHSGRMKGELIGAALALASLVPGMQSCTERDQYNDPEININSISEAADKLQELADSLNQIQENNAYLETIDDKNKEILELINDLNNNAIDHDKAMNDLISFLSELYANDEETNMKIDVISNSGKNSQEQIVDLMDLHNVNILKLLEIISTLQYAIENSNQTLVGLINSLLKNYKNGDISLSEAMSAIESIKQQEGIAAASTKAKHPDVYSMARKYNEMIAELAGERPVVYPEGFDPKGVFFA